MASQKVMPAKRLNKSNCG